MRTFLITAMIATLSLGAPINAQNESAESAPEADAEKPTATKVLNARQKKCLFSADTNLSRRVCLGTPAQRNCAKSAVNRRELQACF
jgi:hypothetical protein